MTHKAGNGSALSAYVQKALERKDSKSTPQPKKTPKPALTAKNSFNAKQDSRKCLTAKPSTKQLDKDYTFPEAQHTAHDLDNLTPAFINPFPSPLICATSTQIAPSVEAKRGVPLDLICAAEKITIRVIKELSAANKPQQSVINIIVGFISVLKLVDEDNRFEAKHKLYPYCIEALKNAEYIHHTISRILEYAESPSKEFKTKVEKVRAKYLVGWDMKPAAFSDKYACARTVLQFLLALSSCVEARAIKEIEDKISEPLVRVHGEEKSLRLSVRTPDKPFKKDRAKERTNSTCSKEWNRAPHKPRHISKRPHDDVVFNLLKELRKDKLGVLMKERRK